MARPSQRTVMFLSVFAVVAVAVLGYVGYNYLKAPEVLRENPRAIPADVPVNALTDPEYLELRPFAELPIVPTNVGRKNPFQLLERPNDNKNTTPANAPVQ